MASSIRRSFAFWLDGFCMLAQLAYAQVPSHATQCPIPRDTQNQVCVNVPGGIAKVDQSTNCYKVSPDSMTYQNTVRGLVELVLKSDPTQAPYVGCVTYPYRGDLYDSVDPAAGNLVHAGIDLKAAGIPVYSAEAGKVASVNYCYMADLTRCKRPDRKDHSTLVIENEAQTRKTVYLHMKDIPPTIRSGMPVKAGDQIGTAWNVGALKGAHLHIEVWPITSPSYGETSAISGLKCGGKCDDAGVARRTNDPFILVTSSPLGIGPPSTDPVQNCSRERSLRSTEFSSPTSVEFINGAPQLIKVYWINYGGHRVFYNSLNPGQSYIQRTFVTHPWVATNANNQCLGVYLPAAHETIVTIR